MRSEIPHEIILASASAIRAEIMTNAGIKFKAKPSYIDEDKIKREYHAAGRAIPELVQALALGKAQAVLTTTPEIIIGADQVLEFKGQVFDKPKSILEARKRLQELRGREHRLIGAVCLLQNGEKPWFHVSTTKLTMRDFSDEFLKDYLHKESESLLACVGAYKFEGLGANLFESVEGDFFSILGLSLLPLMAELRRRGALLV